MGLYNVKEASRYLRKSEETIRRYYRAGIIKGTKCGGETSSIMFTEKELREAMTFEINAAELRDMNRATFDAFIQNGKYALTYNKACEQFGRGNIDLLIANGLLVDRSELMGIRRFLLSDIIAAQAAFKKL